MTGVKLCLVLVFNLYRVNTEESEHIDVYGRDWVVFIDDKGNPHYVNLTIPVETQSRTGLISPLPESSQPKFWLYTRENIHNPDNIVVPVKNKTHYIDNAPLMVLIHGWLSDRDSDSVQLIKNAALADRVLNVIIMDWSCLQTWNYIISAENTESAAEKLKAFVQSLANIYHIRGSYIHFIGHSLGAHVVGLAGIKLKDNNLIISRVTGLDPARPFFEMPCVYPGITKDAAAFVDILHTSVGTLGIYNAVGHADFYPGGGVHQPAVCPVSILPGPCEHSSAYIYFQKSFTIKFDALKCQDYFIYKVGLCNNNEMQEMGELCEPSVRGSYFLDIDTISK